MSLSMRIAPHLPLLRRFSRAVTGSQEAGDAYVAAMLEALIKDITLFPKTKNDHINVYKLFCQLFDETRLSDDPNAKTHAQKDRKNIDYQVYAKLSLLTTKARQAFLLMAVEGFTDKQTMEILNIGAAQLKALMQEASKDIAKQMTTRIMIIEDEPLIAMDIEHLVESLGHEVVGIARTHKEAVAIYQEQKPAMVLADIHLADKSSGIDAVNDILEFTTIPVIFITAFPERLLTGKRPEPTFLVTKPFNPDMVKALISQALFFEDNARKPL